MEASTTKERMALGWRWAKRIEAMMAFLAVMQVAAGNCSRTWRGRGEISAELAVWPGKSSSATPKTHVTVLTRRGSFAKNGEKPVPI